MTLEFKNQISIQPLENSGSGLQFQNAIYIQPKDEGGGGGGDDTSVEFSLYEPFYDMTRSSGISNFLAGQGTAYLYKTSLSVMALCLLCSNWSKVDSISATVRDASGWNASQIKWADAEGNWYFFDASEFVIEEKKLTVTLTNEVRSKIYRTHFRSNYSGSDQYSQFKYTEL